MNGLRQISLSGRVAKGFNCTVKSIIKRKAKLVFLADNCDNKDYKSLITGLCKKYSIPLHNVSDKSILGNSVGIASIRHDLSVRKQVNCSACAIIKFGNLINEDIENFRKDFCPSEEAQ